MSDYIEVVVDETTTAMPEEMEEQQVAETTEESSFTNVAGTFDKESVAKVTQPIAAEVDVRAQHEANKKLNNETIQATLKSARTKLVTRARLA
jgi:hypothetical protein